MTVPEQSTKSFSVRINSDGLCFICLRDCSKVNGSDHSPPTAFPLRSITRFLEIDPKKILKAYLDHDFKRCSDVKVELCGGCSEQVRKFNCLYQTLELTKLKLNECARKISSLIKEAEEEEDRTGEMGRRVTHSGTKGVIVDLRAGISEKCLGFSETISPRVILKRLPESELSTLLSRKTAATGSDSLATPIKIEVLEEEDEFSRSYNDNDTTASHMMDSITESMIAPEQSQTQVKSRLQAFIESCRGLGNFPCPFCKAVVVTHRDLKRHLVNFHLQSFFFPEEEYKEPSLSSHQFSEVVHHLLFQNIFTEHPVTNLHSRCPYCSKMYAKRDVAVFRLHIIQDHEAPLIQKLNELQRDPALQERLLKTPNSWVCECGDHFEKLTTNRVHRKYFCNLIDKAPNAEKMTPTIYILKLDHQQINSSQLADGTLRASCPHCRAAFASKKPNLLRRLLETHLTSFHLHTFFPEENLKEPSLSFYQFQQVLYHQLFANFHTDPGNPNLLKCPNCSVTVPKVQRCNLRLHLVKCHYASLVERVKELQKDPMIFKKLSKLPEGFICSCGVYYSNAIVYGMYSSKFCKLIETTPTNAEMSSELWEQNSEIVHQQFSSPISKSADGTLQKSCSHCRAVVKTKSARNLKASLEEHTARLHLHTLFPEDKHKDPSLSSLQYKQVVHHFLFENILSDPDPKTNKLNYKCGYCEVTHMKIMAIKLHVIKCHRFSLVQRLEELQKDKLILEKLEKIRTALSCECGDYFMSDKQFKLHRKKFCKLNGDHVGSSSSREIDSSTCKTEKGQTMESNNEEMFEVDAEDMYSIDIGEVKPSISLGTDFGEEEIGRSERKRRGSESDSDLSLSETICVPRKVLKLE